ncbi:SpoIID/LytB domain-containing protein [Nocardia camponoti]|uniref:Sporulation stage II protein D amidase enhancer LytB N-terminal domain-containing protein n=1 Tax=Nocardia camponoti TaxID=1616106 RepID=A0A917VA25_9NOCA|nr:SpoIID/LytB domain-containing protein [Nocardia camponoti]GGK55456.1 hypothetical protein GCM10011591_29290 [Nocardia camponoti]
MASDPNDKPKLKRRVRRGIWRRPARPSRSTPLSLLLGGTALLVTGAVAWWQSAPAQITPTVGVGHGRGLSQMGAYDGAREGQSAEEILGYYYPGATLGQIGPTTIAVRLQAQDDSTLDAFAAAGAQVAGQWIGPGEVAHLTPLSGGQANVVVTTGCEGEVLWQNVTDDPFIYPVDPGVGRPANEHLTLCGGTGYRGALGVALDGEAFRTVNRVDIEDYLAGVVPAEMQANWADQGAFEALRAQAIAARSYALAEDRYTYAQTCDTTDCQAYPGTPKEDARSTEAVATTAGTVLLRDGLILRSEYSAAPDGGRPSDIQTFEVGPAPDQVVETWSAPTVFPRSDAVTPPLPRPTPVSPLPGQPHIAPELGSPPEGSPTPASPGAPGPSPVPPLAGQSAPELGSPPEGSPTPASPGASQPPTGLVAPTSPSAPGSQASPGVPGARTAPEGATAPTSPVAPGSHAAPRSDAAPGPSPVPPLAGQSQSAPELGTPPEGSPTPASPGVSQSPAGLAPQVAPSSPSAPGLQAGPASPSAPGLQVAPASPRAPGSQVTPGVPEVPVAPASPAVPAGPGAPASPGSRGTQGTPELPSGPGTQGAPESPSAPEALNVPGSPNLPGWPSAAEWPAIPGWPSFSEWQKLFTSPGVSPGVAVQPLAGETVIDAEYRRIGGAGSVVGVPTAAEMQLPGGAGTYRPFTKGVIVHTKTLGVRVVDFATMLAPNTVPGHAQANPEPPQSNSLAPVR